MTDTWKVNDDIRIHGRIDQFEYTINGERVFRDVAAERIARQPDDKSPIPIIGLSFADAWPAYLAAVNRPDSGPRTLKDYSLLYYCFARWVAKEHRECQELRDITDDIAEEYAVYLLQKVKNRKTGKITKNVSSPGTFNKHVRFLRMVYSVLNKKAKIHVNPWNDIVPKRESRHSRREFTLQELDAICNSAKGEMRTIFVLGIYTGLRLGDCCTLRWAEVDMARRIILRVPNKTARRKNEPVHIPIHSTLCSVLDAIPENKRRKHVVPSLARRYNAGDSMITAKIQNHLTECGIQVHKDGTGTGTGRRAVVEAGFHSLRHSFVSLCRQANAPLAVVEAIVGHSNPAMTRHYTHIGELAASQAVACLPAFVETAGTVQPMQLPQGAQSSQMASAPAMGASLRKIRWILHRMSPASWRADKETLLQLLDVLEEEVSGPAG
jgi:integrase